MSAALMSAAVNPPSKREGRALGAKFYCTGKVCKNGHADLRYTVSGKCVSCAAEWKRKHWRNSLPAYKAWKIANRHRFVGYRRKYALSNGHTIKAYTARYYAANRLKIIESSRVYGHKRRAIIACVGGTYGLADVRRILKAQRHRCAYCKVTVSKAQYHVDHIMPLALGGTNAPANLQITCPSCNLRKHKQHPIDFAQRLGLLL